jgi:hypothetical protein
MTALCGARLPCSTAIAPSFFSGDARLRITSCPGHFFGLGNRIADGAAGDAEGASDRETR